MPVETVRFWFKKPKDPRVSEKPTRSLPHPTRSTSVYLLPDGATCFILIRLIWILCQTEFDPFDFFYSYFQLRIKSRLWSFWK